MYNMTSPTIQNMMYANNMGGMSYGIPPTYMQNGMMNVGGYGYNQPTQQQVYDSKYGANPYSPMYQQQQVSQMAPIGSIGGSYYNNNAFRGYFNPYMYQQQLEMQRIQMQEQMQQESDIMKRLSRAVNHALGEEIDDNYLKQYDYQNPYEQPKMSKEEYDDYLELQQNEHMWQVSMNGMYGNPMEDRIYKADEIVSKQFKSRAPEDMSMLDYFKVSGAVYDDVTMKDKLASDRDGTRIYNKGLYGKLITKQSNPMGSFGSSLRNSMFNHGPVTMNNNLDISDMEIKLPDKLQNEYQRRKQEFMNNLLKG